MRLLKFLGHSDDIFQWGEDEKAVGGDEAYSVDNIHAFLVVDEKGEGFYVCATYAPKVLPCACWCIGIAPLGEDIPLPCWDIRYEAGLRGYYTPILVVSAPDDVTIAPLSSSSVSDRHAG